MAKITTCDICGTVGEGRNPESFHELHEYSCHFSRQSIGYIDMCDKCYKAYTSAIDIYEKEYRQKVANWIKEKQNLKGENDVSRN